MEFVFLCIVRFTFYFCILISICRVQLHFLQCHDIDFLRANVFCEYIIKTILDKHTKKQVDFKVIFTISISAQYWRPLKNLAFSNVKVNAVSITRNRSR